MLNPPLSNVSGNRHARDRFAETYRPQRGCAPTCGYKSRTLSPSLPGFDAGETPALPEATVRPHRRSIRAGIYAPALGRAETSACHFAMLVCSGGTASFAGFMKSMATRAVISATE